MDKFSNIRPKSELDSSKDDVLFSNDYIELVNYEDWTIIKESNFVVCIPYLIESNQVILRHEYVPTFKMADGQEHHLTILSGTIEKGETPEKTLLRELEEEAGIVLRPDFKIEFMKPMFFSKASTGKYIPCLINLTENDYHEVIPTGDGSNSENKSKSVKVDVKYLNSLNASDLITEYMLIHMKKYLNISF